MHFFLQKNAHHSECFFKTDGVRATRQKEPKHSNRALFKQGSRGAFQRRIRKISRKDPQAPCAKQQEARGLHPNGSTFFFKKGTHHAKISRSATRFCSRKHTDDTCSCSTRLEGTRRGFQNSTMKCSGACRYGTHRIPHKEGRRPSPIRILLL